MQVDTTDSRERPTHRALRFVAALVLGSAAARLASCAGAATPVCDCPAPDGGRAVNVANACTADQQDAGCFARVIPGEGPLPPPECPIDHLV